MALHSKKLNSEIRSAPFSEKRKTYKDCPYKLTSQLATVSGWNVKLIDERQKTMAEVALKAWPF
jgi:hypothetical protein